jgi:maleylacetate reductase
MGGKMMGVKLAMNELLFLPQERVCWGHEVLSSTLAKLGDYGIDSPIVFSIPELEHIRATYIEPAIGPACPSLLEFPGHVPDVAVRSALSALREHRAKSIIALGGGSVLDAAKAVSHAHFLEVGSHLPIVALPTTLSGSEFSHYFGITETGGDDKFKRTYAVRETTPKIVILDPVLAEGTPRSLLLSSAIKALDHAIEGMRKINPDHPHAILAARGVSRFFSILKKWPGSLETRQALDQNLVSREDLLNLQLSAWQCYFSPASVIYGLSHRIGHILGGTFGLPHSVTSCITLAPVIKACAEYYGDKFEGFAPHDSTQSPADYLSDSIAMIVRNLGLPTRVSEFGLRREELSKVAAMLEANYPEEVRDLGNNAERKLIDLLESVW